MSNDEAVDDRLLADDDAAHFGAQLVDEIVCRGDLICYRGLVHLVMSLPKKKWGQNFLRNRGAVEKIVAAVEAQPGEVIVEVGPGEGVLTERLVALGNDVQAIEIDPELAARLRQKFGNIIVNADALEVPLPARPFRAVGNLPYNVGTPILRRTIA